MLIGAIAEGTVVTVAARLGWISISEGYHSRAMILSDVARTTFLLLHFFGFFVETQVHSAWHSFRSGDDRCPPVLLGLCILGTGQWVFWTAMAYVLQACHAKWRGRTIAQQSAPPNRR